MGKHHLMPRSIPAGLRRTVSLFAALLGLATAAAQPLAPADLPHAGKQALQDYVSYGQAQPHRAFALAPGGSWSWVSGEPSAQAAAETALANCDKHTEQKCTLYALDDRVVFSREQWVRLWGPYKTAAAAATSPLGTHVGQRFPDLGFTDSRGGERKLSEGRGRVTVLYFWASWCSICRRELPKLADLQHRLAGRKDVELLLVPYRDSFGKARAELLAEGLGDLPLVNPQIKPTAKARNIRTGLRLDALTHGVPAVFVLDKHGIVLFSHHGPIADWAEYLPFFDDARQRSGG